MLVCVARPAILAVALLMAIGGAIADDLADFNAAVENAAVHNRVAIGYLRTGNADLASLEIDRLRAAWSNLTERFAGKRPAAFDGNPLYSKLWTVGSARLVAADMMLNSGRPEQAGQSLAALRGDLYELRKASHVVVLADCVRDANAIMDALMVYNDRALDWTKPETGSGVATAASSYGSTLDRCDGIAGEPVHASPEFRRLVDGAKASLTLIPKAIATHDSDLLHRILIELRSFDNLLAFRFG
jgi:hypothetical protein